MLRLDFPRLLEPEDLYQEAWTEFLELRSRSEAPILNSRALLKRIAWRRATDSYRRPVPDAIDPHGDVLAVLPDEAASPDYATEVRAEAATLRLAIDTLEPREAAVLKLRFDQGMSAKEVQAELDISARRLEKIMTSAYSRVLAAVSPEAGGESPLRRRQRSLLLACEAGIASSRQRAKAKRMLEVDPACGAMLRDIRRTLEDVAAVLPLPVIAELRDRHQGHRLDVVFGWLHDLRAGAVRAADRMPRGSGAAEAAAASGGSAVSAGVAVKVAAFCLAAGGTVAVCGVSLRHDAAPAKKAPRATTRAATARRVEISVPTQTIARTPSKPRRQTPTRTSTKRSKTVTEAVRAAPVSSPKSRPAISPAPAGSTEFGPGAVGSSAAPAKAAVAPTNGGGEFSP